jgi:hypothetical protein
MTKQTVRNSALALGPLGTMLIPSTGFGKPGSFNVNYVDGSWAESTQRRAGPTRFGTSFPQETNKGE